MWIEFDESIDDPNDTYFARVLAIAPDQLISNNKSELWTSPEEPALPIDPEFIRIVTESDTNDLAGLDAMQPMEKSTSGNRHYLLPIPPNLHSNSDEMFGFFTYEFRVGHYKNMDSGDMIWTTAQGRFGRRLRVNGIQHPVPTLTCMPNRDDAKLWVTAPYSVAVYGGKNVTADPPRTQLWALLYAQVKQADNLDYRNILLDDRKLDPRIQVISANNENVFQTYTDEELNFLNKFVLANYKYEMDVADLKSSLKLVEVDNKNKGSTKYGTVVWSNKEIIRMLINFGLPKDSSLSVLVVEILPQITNVAEHISGLSKSSVAQAVEKFISIERLADFRKYTVETNSVKNEEVFIQETSPVSDALGNYRIMRVSPLTAVPPIC
jgi:hypothetical protein